MTPVSLYHAHLQVETSENAWVVLVSYLCMLVYVSFALGRCPDMVRGVGANSPFKD